MPGLEVFGAEGLVDEVGVFLEPRETVDVSSAGRLAEVLEKQSRRARASVAEWPKKLADSFVAGGAFAHALTRIDETMGFPDPAVVVEGDNPGSKFVKFVSPVVGRRFVANPLEAMDIRAKPWGDLWGRDAGEKDELRSCYADLIVAAKAEPPPAPITAKQVQRAGKNRRQKCR